MHLQPVGDVDAILLELWAARGSQALYDEEGQDVKAESAEVVQRIHNWLRHD